MYTCIDRWIGRTYSFVCVCVCVFSTWRMLLLSRKHILHICALGKFGWFDLKIVVGSPVKEGLSNSSNSAKLSSLFYIWGCQKKVCKYTNIRILEYSQESFEIFFILYFLDQFLSVDYIIVNSGFFRFRFFKFYFSFLVIFFCILLVLSFYLVSFSLSLLNKAKSFSQL